MAGSNVVYLKTGGKTSVNVESEGRVIIRPKIVKQVSPPVEGAISPGQRAEFKAMIDEWVNVSGLAGKPINYGGAYKRLFSQAKSIGKAGAGRLDDYPMCDFERGVEFIRSEIGKLRNTNRFRDVDPDAARNAMLGEIHLKVKALGIADSKYRDYLQAEYGVSSSKLLEIGQLQRFRDYIRGGGVCKLPAPKEKTAQELREESLSALMVERGGKVFISMDDAHAQLAKRDPALFAGIGFETFQVFWKQQAKKKICVLKRGRKPSSLESPVAQKE
ncbi:hypothetical protein [Thiothrix winogradskyi]|uniref:Uncharacterized protein n=1 Tax=Thiothrix winogradskyi TaxID=96472 RepID=A0ABY3T2J9_9GAMM|nr:hypothetical protein [Thiothrix winogradskyi]UJS26056.1 hypothetical protein L2Y54_08455 [Thiothrix winogradskyi]